MKYKVKDKGGEKVKGYISTKGYVGTINMYILKSGPMRNLRL